MSDELAQDDDGFEIASIGGSDDEDDYERGRGSAERARDRGGIGEYTARPTSSGSPHVVMKGHQGHTMGGLTVGGEQSTARRDSGEAIFAVGEGDDGSDDDDDVWKDDEKVGKKRA